MREYETAVRLDPENLVYKENCAAACLQIDMVHRAEELLAQVEPTHPSPSVYNLLGNVAILKGERARAELAFNAGLAIDPRSPELLVNLAMLQKEKGNHEKAREMLHSVLSAAPGHALARKLLERIRDEFERRLACGICGREWWVPGTSRPSRLSRFGGSPGRSAGGPMPQVRQGVLHRLRVHPRERHEILLPRLRGFPQALRRCPEMAGGARYRGICGPEREA